MQNEGRGFVINKTQLLFSVVICVFILSEYCSAFRWMDPLHIKHYLMWIVVALYGIALFRDYKNILMYKETKYVVITAVALYAISIFFQVVNGSFKLYSLQEVYYLLIPLIFAVIVFNYNTEDDIDFIITAVLITCIFSWVVTRIDRGTLTLSNFIQMFNLQSLFIDSEASMIESDLSNFFLLLFLYYAYRGKKTRTVISAIMCFLGYKRFAVLYLLVMIILLRFIPKYKKVNRIILCSVIIAFCLAPFAVYYMCTDTFANWFYQQFGIDFNQFTMTRYYIINTVIDADLTNYGLGTVTDWLEVRNVAGQTNMHNDILRIYMETTLIGTVIFTRNYFKIVESNWYSFLSMLFIFMELFVAHFLGPAATSFWTVAYLIVFTFNKDAEDHTIIEAEVEQNECII